MTSLDHWLDEYSATHQHPTNQLIHHVCVPLIMASGLGLLWCIPSPAIFAAARGLNWSTLVVIFALSFYYRLSRVMFVGMLVQVTVMLTVISVLAALKILLPVSAGVFAVAWVFQFWGHRIEGKRPAFLDDLVFLLIGPLWVQAKLFRRLGWL